MNISDRLLNRILKEEDYEIVLPNVKGEKAVQIITATGVKVLSDDSTPDLNGRVMKVTSKGTQAGDAIHIRQKLDAALTKAGVDPKVVKMKVTKL